MHVLFGIMMLCSFTAGIIAIVYGLNRNKSWLIAIGTVVFVAAGLALSIH